MNKKILYTAMIISLIACLPFFSGSVAISPEEASNDDLSSNAIYEYDGNTIEILEQTPEATNILLNDTYLLEMQYNDTDIGVECTKLDPALSINADELLFDIDFQVNDDGTHLGVELPDFGIAIDSSGPNSDEWNTTIFGADVTHIHYNTTSEYLLIDDGLNTVAMDGDLLVINDGVGLYGYLLMRNNDTSWDIITAQGLLVVNFNEDIGVMYIESAPAGVVYSGPIPPLGPPVSYYTGAFLSIYFSGDEIVLGWDFVTITITSYILTFCISYITIVWYWGAYLERMVFLIYDLTIIFYLNLIELLIVIIYYTFEIKIYETQIVIVYEYIEIIFMFVSLFIWELTFIFHFEFWFIQLIFLLQLNITIINQIRIIFIPIIIPVFVTTVYYVPVYINNYIHIYVPYASPALYIDVYDEIISRPNHTIQYLVTDQAGLPLDDATVTIDYNGTTYAADFVADGVYEVVLPMSDETETVEVTAVKDWYPDGSLIYDLNATGIIDTVTQEGPLSLIPVIASLVCLAVGTIFIKRKK